MEMCDGLQSGECGWQAGHAGVGCVLGLGMWDMQWQGCVLWQGMEDGGVHGLPWVELAASEAEMKWTVCMCDVHECLKGWWGWDQLTSAALGELLTG